jgi:hypothetical protein
MKTTGKTRSASGQAQTSIVEHRDPPHDHHLDHDHDHEGRGIVGKGGLYIEKLAGIDTIVLDKTGTLTMGVPEVTGIRVAEGASEHNVPRARLSPSSIPSIRSRSHSAGKDE